MKTGFIIKKGLKVFCVRKNFMTIVLTCSESRIKAKQQQTRILIKNTYSSKVRSKRKQQKLKGRKRERFEY